MFLVVSDATSLATDLPKGGTGLHDDGVSRVDTLVMNCGLRKRQGMAASLHSEVEHSPELLAGNTDRLATSSVQHEDSWLAKAAHAPNPTNVWNLKFDE